MGRRDTSRTLLKQLCHPRLAVPGAAHQKAPAGGLFLDLFLADCVTATLPGPDPEVQKKSVQIQPSMNQMKARSPGSCPEARRPPHPASLKCIQADILTCGPAKNSICLMAFRQFEESAGRGCRLHVPLHVHLLPPHKWQRLMLKERGHLPKCQFSSRSLKVSFVTVETLDGKPQ